MTLDYMIVIGVFLLVLSLYGIFTNDKTYKQRKQIIDRIYRKVLEDIDSDTYAGRSSFWSMFAEVTYDQHHREVLCFRDPYKLYSPEIQQLMEKK